MRRFGIRVRKFSSNVAAPRRSPAGWRTDRITKKRLTRLLFASRVLAPMVAVVE
jgi:hypothetical protein